MFIKADISKRLTGVPESEEWSGSEPLGLVTLLSKAKANPPKKQLNKQTAFIDKLYKTQWSNLCSWLRSRYGAGPPEPEDLAQSAFEKISHVKGLEEMDNPRAYLFTVAARNALDELRGLTVRRKYIHQIMLQYGDEVGEITPERVYCAREEIKVLTEDMKKLSPVQKEVVMRSRIMGQTYTEIKDETGWSTSAISRHLKNAMIIIAEKAKAREENEKRKILDN